MFIWIWMAHIALKTNETKLSNARTLSAYTVYVYTFRHSNGSALDFVQLYHFTHFLLLLLLVFKKYSISRWKWLTMLIFHLYTLSHCWLCLTFFHLFFILNEMNNVWQDNMKSEWKKNGKINKGKIYHIMPVYWRTVQRGPEVVAEEKDHHCKWHGDLKMWFGANYTCTSRKNPSLHTIFRCTDCTYLCCACAIAQMSSWLIFVAS